MRNASTNLQNPVEFTYGYINLNLYVCIGLYNLELIVDNLRSRNAKEFDFEEKGGRVMKSTGILRCMVRKCFNYPTHYTDQAGVLLGPALFALLASYELVISISSSPSRASKFKASSPFLILKPYR